MSTEPLSAWLERRRRLCDMAVREIPWRDSREWVYRDGALRHHSGGFFSIIGVESTADGAVTLRQPLINQPEIGILGFLLQRRAGVPYLLIQAKPEPGNIGLCQAAPSVQATWSNYQRLHHGKATPFLCYFTGDPAATVLADSLQSEQGTRFLGKYNRNMMVEVPEDLELPCEGPYHWAPAAEVCDLLVKDFQINTDARSVLATSDWTALAAARGPFARWHGRGGLGEDLLRSYLAGGSDQYKSDAAIVQRLASVRCAHPFSVRVVPLDDQRGWLNGQEPRLIGPAGSFDVRQMAVSCSEREVQSWDQPLVAQNSEGRAVVLARKIRGVLHFLFRCRPEIGFQEGFQYGPAIQDAGGTPSPIPALDAEERQLEALSRRAVPALSNLQSDEGGRFYCSVARYSILLLEDAEPLPESETLSWMTLGQIARLVHRQGLFSNEARSLISMLLAYL